MRNLPLTFDYSTYNQKLGEDYMNFNTKLHHLRVQKPKYVVAVSALNSENQVSRGSLYLITIS